MQRFNAIRLQRCVRGWLARKAAVPRKEGGIVDPKCDSTARVEFAKCDNTASEKGVEERLYWERENRKTEYAKAQYAIAQDPVHPAVLNPKAYGIYWKDQVPYIPDGQMEFAGDYYDAEKGNLQTQTDKEEAKLTNLLKKVLQTKGVKPEHALGVVSDQLEDIRQRAFINAWLRREHGSNPSGQTSCIQNIGHCIQAYKEQEGKTNLSTAENIKMGDLYRSQAT